MRRARDPRRPHPLLRSKEGDLEASYRKPVPRIEVLRIVAKFAFAAVAGVWFKFAIEDQTDEGAKLLLAVGATAAVAGLIDLLYLRKHDIELVFARNRKQQIQTRGAVMAGGLAALLVALTRLL